MRGVSSSTQSRDDKYDHQSLSRKTSKTKRYDENGERYEDGVEKTRGHGEVSERFSRRVGRTVIARVCIYLRARLYVPNMCKLLSPTAAI